MFKQFIRDRNLKKSTIMGYENAIKLYEQFHNASIDELIKEARQDEYNNVALKDRRIKIRLVEFRSFLFDENKSANTIRTYFSKIRTFYSHFEIELPYIPPVKYSRDYQASYLDLPTRDDIRQALEISAADFRSVILFMCSSGTAKAETLSLTIGDFINATKDYHSGGDLNVILDTLSGKNNIVPTFYLKRLKTDK